MIFKFSEELIGKDGYVRLLDPRCIKNINHLFRYQCLVDYLADGSVDFIAAAAFAGAIKLGKTRFDGLEESNFILGIECLFMGNGNSESLRQGSNLVDVAFFAVFQTENVFLRSQD